MKQILFLTSICVAAIDMARAGELGIPAPDGSRFLVTATVIGNDPSGNVRIEGRISARHGKVEIQCDGKGTVYMSRNLFSAFDAEGNITAHAANKRMWGQHIFYEEPRHLIIVSGDPRVQEGSTTYSAKKRILCYTETGVMRFEPSAEIFIDKSLDREMKKQKGRNKFLGLF